MSGPATPAMPDALHNIEAEQALLGTLLYENDVLENCEWLEPSHFYDPVNGRVFEWCVGRIQKGQLADPITLNKQAKADEGLAEIGGAQYLANLLTLAADSVSAIEYARTIEDLAKRRALHFVFRDAVADCERAERADDVTEAVEARLAELSGTARDVQEIKAGDALRKALERPVRALQTGLVDLDRLNVIAPSLVIVGGRSSMGKSAFTLDLARRTAQRGMASLILSNEMTDRQIAARLSSQYCQVPYTDILHGNLTPETQPRVAGTLEKLDGLPLTIIGVPGASVAAIQAIVRRWKRDQMKAGNPIGVVALDYIQNIKGEGGSLYESMSGIASALQTMQLRLDVCLVVACQLNRANERESNKRPTISSLRDSGKIEEVADSVILLHRESYYADRESERHDPVEEADRLCRANSREVEVDVAKNRHGGIGKISLWADLKFNQFDNWSR
jgi:replicative DNA helicase